MSAVCYSAFGISVGDIVHTSYGTGPYRIRSICPPHYVDSFAGDIVIRTWPVISLTCVYVDKPGARPDDAVYINDIRLEGERWFTDQNCEVLVTPDPSNRPAQMPLVFGEEYEKPYPFQPGVDYSLNVWKCERCGVDFNATPEHGPAWHCKYPGKRVLVMRPRCQPPAHDISAMQQYLGLEIKENGYVS